MDKNKSENFNIQSIHKETEESMQKYEDKKTM